MMSRLRGGLEEDTGASRFYTCPSKMPLLLHAMPLLLHYITIHTMPLAYFLPIYISRERVAGERREERRGERQPSREEFVR